MFIVRSLSCEVYCDVVVLSLLAPIVVHNLQAHYTRDPLGRDFSIVTGPKKPPIHRGQVDPQGRPCPVGVSREEVTNILTASQMLVASLYSPSNSPAVVPFVCLLCVFNPFPMIS